MCNTRIDEIAFQLVSNPWFDRVILVTITVNGVFLALYDPTKGSAEQEAYLTIGDYIFSGVFIAELLVKWLALSIPTYFKDKWNWVDFIVVLESVVSLVLEAVRPSSSLDISALRGLRVLRPLRAITYVQQVKLLFETVISAFKVVNTLFLCVGCVLLFFGNVGYTYWADAFSYTCVDTLTLEPLSEELVCGGGYACPVGYSCQDAGRVALNHEVTGYHDIWHAMLQVFQVVSLDGWQETMWNTQDAAGEVTWIYFVVLLVLGNVLLVSMFPAVLSTKLEAAIQREEERKRLIVQAEHSNNNINVVGMHDNKGKRTSEFETLLNEYSKMEADEIASFQRLAAVRRGDVREDPEEEPPLPRWTPFPDSPLLNRLRKAVLQELGPFAIGIYAIIFLNAFVLCLGHTGASENTEAALTGLNKAFTVMFAIETVVKLGLLGPVGYFTDGYNVFDFVITLLNLVEITMEVAGFFSGLRVIRIFRIARVMRLASLGKLGRTKFNPSPQVDLGRMVGIVVTSTPWIVNIYAVQLLLMYTFTVLGMQFFGGALPDVQESDNSIRFNYNSFGKAGITLLDLLTGNLWSEVMFDTVGATGEQTGIIFYVVWLVLSRWLVVAMVVTVLFYRIDVDTEDYLKIAAKTSMRSVFALENAIMQCHKSHVFFTWRRRYEEATGNRSSNRGQIKLLKYAPPVLQQPGPWKRAVASTRSLLIFGPRNPIRELCRWLTSSTMVALLPMPQHGDLLTSTITVAPGGGGSSGSRGIGIGSGTGKKRWGDTMATAELTQFTTTNTLSGAHSQGCWRDLLGREELHRRVRFTVEAITTLAVAVTMVVVSLDVEIFSGRRTTANNGKSVTHVLETAAVCVFIAEAAMLIVARGLVLLPNAYLRDSYDVMNFSLTVLSAICLWVFDGATWDSSFAVSAVKALRALTVVRLLKFTRLSHELENLLKALRSSGKALCLAGGVALFFLLQWSIVGLQVWEGTFGYCSDAAAAAENGTEDYYVYRTDENGIEGQSECEAAGYEWKNASWNFDSFGNALQSVLVIFTFNGWQEILFAAVNARVSSEGLNAEEWNSAWAGLFFLCVLMISLVLVLLVVGVVFSMYTFLNLTKNSGQRLSSLKQAFWTMYAAKLDNMQPDTIPSCPRDANPLRRFLFNVATNPRWGILLASLIGANVVVRFLIGSEWLHYSDAPMWIHIQEAVFAAVFVSEWVSRVVAFGGIRAVTRSPFQIADSLSTVVLALVFVDEIVFLTGWMYSSSSPFWKAVKAVSMVRLVRLGNMLPHVQEILLVAVESSSVVFPLLLILTALTYLWSVCGVIIFGNETYLAALFGGGNPWEAVNRHRGFFGVAQGMQTMLGVATTPGSDGWVTVMQRYEDVTPLRWRWGVLLFFGSFALLTRFLLVNFFIITLLFKYKTHSNDKVGVAMEQVNQFKHAWMGHAFTYTKEYRTIYAGQLVGLLRKLPPPLGVGSDGSHYDCQILAKKVLCAMGVEAMAGIPAKQISDVLSPFGSLGGDGSGGKHQSPQDGPGLIKLPFSKVLVAVHRIVLFGVTLEDERQVKEHRGRARNNLSVLKLGVHRFLAMRVKRRVMSSSLQREEVAVAECSLLRTQLPATFMTRSSMALTAEFLRWRDHVDLRGYDNEANLQGRCLHSAATHEIETTAALEQLTAKLAELHVGDRNLLSRLAEIRQHIITLNELRAKLDTARGEYLRTDWDGGSLRVRQTVEDERKAGLTGMCASMDGAWVFSTTETGLLKVFKRGRATRFGSGKPRQKGSYSLVQSVGVAENGSSTKGLCVACSPDGYMVVVGCSDSTVRTFTQDTTGLRRAVHAMKAEGKRGRKPTVSYRPGSIGKGHHAAVRCAAWLEPGHFYTGGGGGTVCMWRKNKAATPAQSIDVCRSTFFSGVVQCLAVWRTAYTLGLLASCVDVDDSQDVEPPVYLLVGDGDGYLSVLPARTDSKFFAIDVWKSSWKQQVETGKGAGGVTATEAVWGRVYTASGSSGLIKAWTPRWADATKERLLALVQVGQYAVHSGPVSAIVYSKGLMFSAGKDLSIVIWYPPRESSASPPTQQQPPHPPTPPSFRENDKAKHNLDSLKPPSPAPAPPSATSTADDSAGGAGFTGAENDFQAGGVTHENEPGVVLHVAGVVGMAVVPGGLVSADLAGRLIVQAPDRLTESHRVQMMPSEDSIQRFRPLALEVLKARGRARGSSAATAAATGAGLAGGGSANPTGPAALVPQASLDHLCTLRFLLRAKAKRRLKEEIGSEKQRVADLNTATMFARSMGQDREAGTQPEQGGRGTRSSSGNALKEIRRRSLLHSVSIRVKLTTDGEDVSQDTADVSKMAEMDQKPAFLQTSGLERLADHPDVYLAELMSHFFPGRDLAPPPSSAAARGGSVGTTTRGGNAVPTTPTRRGSGNGKGNRRIGAGGLYLRGALHPRTVGGGRGAPSSMFSATQDVTTSALPRLRGALRSGAMGGGKLGGVNEEEEEEEEGQYEGFAGVQEAGEGGDWGGGVASVGGKAERPNLGALIERARRARQGGEEEKDGVAEPTAGGFNDDTGLAGAKTPPGLNEDSNDREAETPRGFNSDNDRELETDADPEGGKYHPGCRGRAKAPMDEIYEDSIETPTEPGAVLVSPPLGATASVVISGEESEERSAERAEERSAEQDLRNQDRQRGVTPAIISHGENNAAPAIVSHGDNNGTRAVSRGENTTSPAVIINHRQNNASDNITTNSSYIGDNLSTAQRRRRGGSITVYVPRSPEPGVWAAGVQYDGTRDIAWVLSEALRMFGRENRPIARHAGLARRPRLVQSSGGRLGLFKGGKTVWKQSPAFPVTSSVGSVLSPGEEVVVLVEGFDPAVAFGRRVSVCIPPPAGGYSGSSGGWERAVTDDAQGHARGIHTAVDGLHPAEQRTGAAFGENIRSRYDEKRNEERASECEDNGDNSSGMANALLTARGHEANRNAAALPREAVSSTIRAPSDGAQRFARADAAPTGISLPASPTREGGARGGGCADGIGKASIMSRVIGAGGGRGWKGNGVRGSHQGYNNHGYRNHGGRFVGAVDAGEVDEGYGDYEDDDDDDDTLTDEEDNQGFRNKGGRIAGGVDEAFGDDYNDNGDDNDDDDTLTGEEEEEVEEGATRLKYQTRGPFHVESPGPTTRSHYQRRGPFHQEESPGRTTRNHYQTREPFHVEEGSPGPTTRTHYQPRGSYQEGSPGRTARNHYHARGSLHEGSPRQTARSGGISSRPETDYNSQEQLSRARDNSVTTGGLEGRCEEERGDERQRSAPQGGADGEGQGQQRPGAFAEPRSPPRSLMSAMFSAWGNG